MKRIINILKTLALGLVPALSGGCAMLGVWFGVHNLHAVSTGSGWWVVLSFLLAIVEFTLSMFLIYEHGQTQTNAKNWIAHKRAEDAKNNDSSSDDETSYETTDTSSDPVTTKRKAKKAK